MLIHCHKCERALSIFETGTGEEKKSFNETPWAGRANGYLTKITEVSQKKWAQIFQLTSSYINTSDVDSRDLVAESAGSEGIDMRAEVRLSDDEESE